MGQYNQLALRQLAGLLAGRSAEVVWGNGNSPSTNGKTIFMPEVGSGKDGFYLGAAHIAHEVGHIRWTDFDVDCSKIFVNAMEDIRIDHKLYLESKGVKEWRGAMIEHLRNRGGLFAPDESNPFNVAECAAFYWANCHINGMELQDEAEKYCNSLVGFIGNEGVNGFLQIAAKIQDAIDTSDTMVICNELLTYLMASLASPAQEASNGEASDGEASDGEASDGEASDGEASDGEASDGEASDGEASDGEASDGEASDGEASDGEASDGEASDGEATWMGYSSKSCYTADAASTKILADEANREKEKKASEFGGMQGQMTFNLAVAKQTAKKLENRLKQAFQVAKKGRERTCDTGMLSPSLLPNYKFGTDVFEECLRKRKANDAEIALLVDSSGSMEDIFSLAAETAFAVKSAMDALKLPATVISFGSGYKVLSMADQRAEGNHRNFTYFDGGGTNVAPALQHAVTLLKKSTKARKLVFLITDGHAHDGTQASFVIGEGQKNRIEFYGIGINEDVPLIDKSVRISSVEELTPVLFGLLSRNMYRN